MSLKTSPSPSAQASPSGAASASPSASASASPSATSSPAAQLMVIVIDRLANPQPANPIPETVEIVDSNGQIRASADFNAPAAPYVQGCASVLPPTVRVAGSGAFFADSAGAIHRLGADGSVSQVASFPITAQSFLSFAVSPDGQKLEAIVFSTPPLTGATPQLGVDPYQASGHWTLDLETAPLNGATTKVLHKDYGHTLAANFAGPTLMAGWDNYGPAATLNSFICTQNVVADLEYTGHPLVHLGADGSHLDSIGGSTCVPVDELRDATILCNSGATLSVRSRTGNQYWSRSAAGFIQEPHLARDANGIAINGDHVEVFLRSKTTPVAVSGQILGWLGNSQLVVARNGVLGLVPTANLGAFNSLGVQVPGQCSSDCGVSLPVAMAGEIDL